MILIVLPEKYSSASKPGAGGMGVGVARGVGVAGADVVPRLGVGVGATSPIIAVGASVRAEG